VSLPERKSIDQIEVDTKNLYREETYTDLRVASIRCLIPIRPDGSPDPGRERLFTGETTIMSNAGPLPVSFRLEASSLDEACAKFPAAVREAVERLVQEAREIQRREASRIVTPGEFSLPELGGVLPVPPGGKIKLG
jgi:hypothetical protein